MNKFKGKNILVTGGTGFIGSHLVENLVNSGANVVTTFQTNYPKSYFKLRDLDKKITMVNSDICDFEKIFNIVTKFNIECIFHLAAQSLIEVSFNNPKQTLKTNILGTVNILETARLLRQIKAVIVASSDKAYGKLKKKRYLETDSLKGDHPYEVSKSAADLICFSYFKTYNIPVVVNRCGNIYGEGDLNFSRIIPGIMMSLIKNTELNIRSNGKFIRDYIYVKDIVNGYLLTAQNIDKVRGEVFNLGSNETLSVIDLIKLAEKILRSNIRFKILNTAKNEIPYQTLDYTKIKKHLNWKPIYSIMKTLPDILNWYKNFLH